MSVLAGAGGRVEPAGSVLELGFVDGGGVERRASLAACAEVRFEDGMAVRQFRWSRGQRHLPGFWWSSTTGTHLGYESWLERDHVMLLDFDPETVAIAVQVQIGVAIDHQQAQPAQTVQDRAQRRQLAQVELARPVGRYPGDHRGAFGQHVREGGIAGQDGCLS